jgi:hypothetical protein
VAHDIREVNRLAVHQDELDLGMRHTQRLDHVFDGCPCLEAVNKAHLPAFYWKKIVEFSVEPEFSLAHAVCRASCQLAICGAANDVGQAHPPAHPPSRLPAITTC